jgi:hypothetical protein
MIQGAIIAALTLMLALISAITLLPQNLVEIVLSRPAIGFSEVTALAGLGLYLVIGVIGTGLTAQFYYHFEVRSGRPYRGSLSRLCFTSYPELSRLVLMLLSDQRLSVVL